MTPYRIEKHEYRDYAQTVTVWAKNQSTALWDARVKFQANVHKELNYTDVDVRLVS